MTAILLTSLFVASGIFAAHTILDAWRHYGDAILSLRGDLTDCGHMREVLVTTRSVKVHSAAVVLRPEFKSRDRSPVPTAHELPAAA